MNPEYRIYWKTKDGGRYLKVGELKCCYLTCEGEVWYINNINNGSALNITAEVVVEMWTARCDKTNTKVFKGDIIIAGWHFDKPTLIEDLESFYYAMSEYGLDGSDLEIVGNKHDSE